MAEGIQGITPYHAKYFAWELTRRRAASEDDRLSQSLFDASVDLNPHQIDAALVQCLLWATRRRRQLVICPAAWRKALSAWPRWACRARR